jgi:hypothetical protein
MVTLGCSAADLVQRNLPTPTPLATRQLAPTFTPTPEDIEQVVVVTPPDQGTPGVIIIPPGMDPKEVLPVATPTPVQPTVESSVPPDGVGTAAVESTPTETPTPSPSPTPSATPTVTSTPTATPFIQSAGGLVNLREGPSDAYPLVAQLGPDIPVAIIGQNPEGTWLQICCVSGDSVWVPRQGVLITNDVSGVPLQDAPPPPPPTPTGTVTPTGTPTLTPTPTRYPFDRAIGPQFFPTNNEFLTIWAKLFVQPDTEREADPAEGYYLRVLFEGFERRGTNDLEPSANDFALSAPKGAGNSVEYNFKYEYTPPDPKGIDCNTLPPEIVTRCRDGDLTRAELIGNGTWTIFVVDGDGNQLSDEVEFETSTNNFNREIYVGWNRVR